MSLGYPQEILEFEYDPSFPVRLVKNMPQENGCNTRFKNVTHTQLLTLMGGETFLRTVYNVHHGKSSGNKEILWT